MTHPATKKTAAMRPTAEPPARGTSATVVPTILARTKEEFRTRLQQLLPVAKDIHVDFEDGRFVPSVGVSVHDIPDLRSHKDHFFEAHLMVEHPGAYIQPLASRGFRRFIVPIEVINHAIFENLRWQCAKHGVSLGIVLNPETSPHTVMRYIDDVDVVMFMGVHPGFNGAAYIPQAERVRTLLTYVATEKPGRSVLVQIDGGMTPQTVSDVVAAGARRINSGSYELAHDPRIAMRELREAAAVGLSRGKATSAARRTSQRTLPEQKLSSRKPPLRELPSKKRPSRKKPSPRKRTATRRGSR